MSDGATVRIACPACGRSRRFTAGRAPDPLPRLCPGCGGELVADGLLLGDVEPVAAPAAPAGWEVAAVAVFAALLARSYLGRGWLAAIVSGADLVFHEAGHPVLGLLGSRFLMFLGGTLGQLAFPVAAAVAFAARRRAAPFAVAVVWLGFNLVEVGRYAADAADRILPLLAPDEDSHDWWNMLGMLGVRHRCREIGGAIGLAGALLWAGAPAWAGWRWLRGRRRIP